jgi:hypothetical protein
MPQPSNDRQSTSKAEQEMDLLLLELRHLTDSDQKRDAMLMTVAVLLGFGEHL